MISWFGKLMPGDWALLIGLLANAAATLIGMKYINRKVDLVHISENRRQEIVAVKVDNAAALVLAVKEQVTEQNSETQRSLNQIHTLVNSNLTREMHDRLVAIKGQVHLTQELIRLSKLNNLEPGEETTASLTNLEMAVSHLETALRERGTATERAGGENT